MRAAISAALATLLLSAGVCRGQEAQRLLDASGVRAGLIVHVDCGDGRLTTDLGRSGRYLVRGLVRGDPTEARSVELERKSTR